MDVGKREPRHGGRRGGGRGQFACAEEGGKGVEGRGREAESAGISPGTSRLAPNGSLRDSRDQ